MNEVGIGLLGFGTVGAGVVEGLLRNGDLIAARRGFKPVLRRIADIDLERDRGVAVDRALLTTDAEAVVRDPNTDIVVELIGGCGIARKLVLSALEAGKPVVTANKALLADHGREIYEIAVRNKTEIFFEAAVGGGIPVIKALREGLCANRIASIYGILNGTCNYILTRMEQEGLPFDEVLKAAQAAGYAEADPSLDIDGLDTAHKAVILASLAHGFPLTMGDVAVEGIRGLAAEDIRYAHELGYRIKLLAVIKTTGEGVEARVQPALVPLAHPLAAVSGVFNAVLIRGDLVGDTLYLGRGAGREATASAVLGDIADASQMLGEGLRQYMPFFIHAPDGRVAPIEEARGRSYLRMTLLDRPGVLGLVANSLARSGIGIASVMQKEGAGGAHVPVVAVTHEAPERSFREAVAAIDALEAVGAPTVRLRIEDVV